MFQSKKFLPVVCFWLFTFCATVGFADSFSVGQKVEVREGDTWSSASVIAHEGRKFKVHYDGSDAANDEWVMPDRIRQSNQSTATPPQPVSHTPVTDPVKTDDSTFKIGDHIEAKWGGLWRKAVISNKSKEWTLVLYDNVWYEWVQPWRLRQEGSTADTTLDSSPRTFVTEFTPAPTDPPDSTAGGHHPAHRRGNNPPGESDPADSGTDAFHISESVAPGGLPISKIDLSGHDIGTSAVAGTPAPDAVSKGALKRVSLQSAKFALGSKMEVLINPQANFALVVAKPSNYQNAASVERVDLAGAVASQPITLPVGVVPLALSLDGKRLVTRSDKFFPATKWRLDLWSMEDKPTKPLLSFRPYPVGENANDQLLWASYVDDAHLLTCSAGHALSLWEISDTKATLIYTLHGDGNIQPRLSSGGKYFIASYGGDVSVFDAVTGKCAATCTDLNAINGMTANVDPTISRLVLSGASRLTVCDLQSSKVLLDVGLPTGVTGSEVDWMSPNLLLLDNRWVFDVAHHAMVWEYTTHGKAPIATWVKNRLCVLLENEPMQLVFANLMSAEVANADRQVTDAKYQIQPGTKVSLEVNVPGTTQDKEQIIEALTQRVQKAGLIVAENQSIRLVADSKEANARQVTYHSRGIDRGSETVSVANTVQTLSFIVDSLPVWSVNSTVYANTPMVVFHKANETIAQTLEQQKKNVNFGWFKSTGIPQNILGPVTPAGSSSLANLLTRD